MDGVIRVRFANDMWWTEIPLEQAVNSWNRFEVSYMDDKTCFVKIDGDAMELHRDDYDKILDKKAFRLKFELKKHNPFDFEKKDETIFVSPGVYITEHDITGSRRIVEQADLIVSVNRGPNNEPRIINNENEFQEIFGQTDD